MSRDEDGDAEEDWDAQEDDGGGFSAYRVVRYFSVDRVDSLSFSRDGVLLAAGTQTGFLCLFRVDFGREKGARKRMPEGCNSVTFSPHPGVVLTASNPLPDSRNSVFAYDFQHEMKVGSWNVKEGVMVREIVMNPANDTFQVSSDDGFIRLFDLRTDKKCIGEVRVGNGEVRNVSTYDFWGSGFAVSHNAAHVLLYDSRQISRPHNQLAIPRQCSSGISAMRYRLRYDDDDGEVLAVLGVNGTLCGLHPGYGGGVERKPPVVYQRRVCEQAGLADSVGGSLEPTRCEPAWFDSRTLVCGDPDGHISYWPSSGGAPGSVGRLSVVDPQAPSRGAVREHTALARQHPLAVGPLRVSPTANVAASACKLAVCLWMPTHSKDP
eukprot:Hpha_TRINITY_DN29742_c0_g1::TRINITY_DN29742_c0_g1_i1::g.2622::m.2622/K14962/WDR82, SWD2, CPS35; COMPASS component SWD2